jgi:hypothetical protein
MTANLPVQFAALEPFHDEWALPTENARHDKRRSSTPQALRAFYDRMSPLFPDILKHLDGFELGKLPAPEQRLMLLAHGFLHVSVFVEIYKGQIAIPFAFEEKRLVSDYGDMPFEEVLSQRLT